MHGWKTVPLGELCTIEIGRTPSRASPRMWDPKRGSGNVWLSIADLPEGIRPSVSDSKEYVSDEGAQRCKLVQAGTLLVSFKLTLGRMAIAGRDLFTNEAIAALTLKSSAISIEYLYWYLTHFDWDAASEGDEKVKGKTFNKAKLLALPVLLPPPSEQKRIVAILDEAFEGIRIATANAERNLANARELFDAASENLFGGAAHWQTYTLEQLLESNWIVSHLDGNHGSEYPRKEEFVADGVPYISANCIVDEGIDFDLAKYLAPERADRIRKGVARDRDVLFAHNATVGPVALLRTEQPRVILGTSLTYYRCNEAHILPKYLAHYMRTPLFRRQYELVMRQSTRNQVPITKQREFTHVVPPIEDQRRIAATLDQLEAERQALLAGIQAKIAQASSLKLSILSRAFSGQLTATRGLAA